jgi:rubrerythrin
MRISVALADRNSGQEAETFTRGRPLRAMTVSVRISRAQTRQRAARRASGPLRRAEHAPEASAAEQAAVSPELRATRRARAAGGPEDRALYNCQCGHLFQADVSASVGCPSCGGEQAW